MTIKTKVLCDKGVVSVNSVVEDIDVFETAKSIEATQTLLQSFFDYHDNKYRPNGKKNIYLYGGWFNIKQRQALIYVAWELACNPTVGHIFIPLINQCEDAVMGTHDWARKVYKSDVNAIDNADIGVGVLLGKNDENGSAFEVGYMVANHKPVIAYVGSSENVSNLMITESVTTVITDTNTNTEIRNIDMFNIPVIEFDGKLN